MANWRLIEDALCDYFRATGHTLDTNSARDKIAKAEYDDVGEPCTISFNLTDLAKHLANSLPAAALSAKS